MIPQRTFQRLITYRKILEQLTDQGTINTFSVDLAELSGCTAVQVRSDLMCVGYSGSPQNGYIVKELHKKIQALIEPTEGISMALIGIGNLGRAILGYFGRLHPKFNLIAAFDTDENKTNRVICGCKCYPISEIRGVLLPNSVQLGIITVPSSVAQEAANLLSAIGVKGIVNFAPTPIKLPNDIFVENMDITSTFEKVAYFARFQSQGDAQ